MIHTISGLMSSGKTLYTTSLCFKDFCNGNVIYSNIHLNFPYVTINTDSLIYLALNNIDISDTSFLLDEFWLFMDSRRAMSNLSICLNWFFLQSSKGNNIKIYLTSQTLHQLDSRIRDNQHFFSLCDRKLLLHGNLYNIPQKMNYIRKLPKDFDDILVIEIVTFSQNNLGQYNKIKTEYMKPQFFYRLYDTEEKIINKKEKDTQENNINKNSLINFMEEK